MIRRPLSILSLAQLLAVLGGVALAACSSSKEPRPAEEETADDDTEETGGTKSTSSKGGGGSTTQGSKAGGGSKGTGGTSKGTGGTSKGAGGAAGEEEDGTGGKTTGRGGAAGTTKGAGGEGTASQGGSKNAGGDGGKAGGGEAGSTEVTCSNTDKTILPVDDTGWVDKSCNACGIQGAFYWYGDANTTAAMKCGGAACAQGTPPYKDGSGMCISGTSTGTKTDYGAGIGLSLNDSGGENSVKGSFDATKAACGALTGFEVTLSGKTGGMPVRIGFSNTADGSTISPFVPVADPNGTSVKTTVAFKDASIPKDWDKTDPATVDTKAIYDLSVQIATDSMEKQVSYDLCVTGVKPLYEGSGTTAAKCTGTNVGTISSNYEIRTLGSGLAFQNNINNKTATGSQSVTGTSGSNCVAMSVSTTSITTGDKAPASYPSILNGWHWGNWGGSYSKSGAKTISALSSAVTSMSFTAPTGQKWDVAYDMWVGKSTSPAGKDNGPDSNTIEVMVWLDYSNATTTNPITDLNPVRATTSVTLAGTSWEVWVGKNDGGWNVVSYRRSPSTAPVTDSQSRAVLEGRGDPSQSR